MSKNVCKRNFIMRATGQRSGDPGSTHSEGSHLTFWWPPQAQRDTVFTWVSLGCPWGSNRCVNKQLGECQLLFYQLKKAFLLCIWLFLDGVSLPQYSQVFLLWTSFQVCISAAYWTNPCQLWGALHRSIQPQHLTGLSDGSPVSLFLLLTPSFPVPWLQDSASPLRLPPHPVYCFVTDHHF